MLFISTFLEPQREISRKYPMGFSLWTNASIHIISNSTEHSGDFFCASPLKGNQITSCSVNPRQLLSLGRAPPPEHPSGPASHRPSQRNHLWTGERRACGQGSSSWGLRWSMGRGKQRKGRAQGADASLCLRIRAKSLVGKKSQLQAHRMFQQSQLSLSTMNTGSRGGVVLRK